MAIVYSIFKKGSSGSIKEADKILDKFPENDNHNEGNILKGSTGKQLSFLCQVLEEGNTDRIQRTYDK